MHRPASRYRSRTPRPRPSRRDVEPRDQLPPEDIFIELRRPVARIALCERQSRLDCLTLRAAWSLHVLNEALNAGRSLWPFCSWCGEMCVSCCPREGDACRGTLYGDVAVCHTCTLEFGICRDCSEWTSEAGGMRPAAVRRHR